jgi:hypothetical protein
MIVQKILLPSITATSLMTLFSHFIAAEEKKNFSEAKLLGKIEKKQLHIPKRFAISAGWTTHYTVGVMMTLLFEMYKLYVNKKPAAYHTMIYGAFAGLLAIGAWSQLLKMLPRRSGNYYKKFYMQLIFAHVIFAAALTAAQKATRKF